MRPSDRKYLETHEWGKLEGDVVILGITDFAVSALSDLTHIDLPEVGDEVSKGDPFGEIESVKTVSDLLSLVSGEVVEVNAGLVDEEDFDLLANSAFEDGWMVKIKSSNATELDEALDAAAYEKVVKKASEE